MCTSHFKEEKQNWTPSFAARCSTTAGYDIQFDNGDGCPLHPAWLHYISAVQQCAKLKLSRVPRQRASCCSSNRKDTSNAILGLVVVCTVSLPITLSISVYFLYRSDRVFHPTIEQMCSMYSMCGALFVLFVVVPWEKNRFVWRMWLLEGFSIF